MHPVHFEGSFEIHKPKDMTDEQCISLWAKFGIDFLLRLNEICKDKRFKTSDMLPPSMYSGIDSDKFPYYLTAWKPNKEDIEAQNRGEPIYIKTVSNRLPPMAIFTFDAEGNANI